MEHLTYGKSGESWDCLEKRMLREDLLNVFPK